MNRCRIKHPSRPVHQTLLAKPSMPSLQARVERPFIPPGPEAIVHHLPRAQSFWPITPRAPVYKIQEIPLSIWRSSRRGRPMRSGFVTISLTRSHSESASSYRPTMSPTVPINRPAIVAKSLFRQNLVFSAGIKASLLGETIEFTFNSTNPALTGCPPICSAGPSIRTIKKLLRLIRTRTIRETRSKYPTLIAGFFVSGHRRQYPDNNLA